MKPERGRADGRDQHPVVVRALTRTSMGSGGTVACLRTMTYLTTRQWLRRLRGLGGKPWALLGLAIAVGLVAVGEVLALHHLGTSTPLNLRPIDPLLRFAPLLLPFLLWRAIVRAPLRAQVADVSWLLTAPGGPRAMVAWKLLVRPLAYALAVFLGTLLARWWSGLSLGAGWKFALIGAIVGLTIRLVSIGGHLIEVRTHVGTAVRVVAVSWGLVVSMAALLTFPGSAWLDLRPVTERIVAGALDPSAVSGWWLLTLLSTPGSRRR